MASQWQPPKDWQTRPVVVLGGGVLGRRIGACWAAGGWPVIIRDPSAAQREQAIDYIKANINQFIDSPSKKVGSYKAEEDLATAVKDTWLVVEAVPEKLDLKTSTFADLERLAPKDAIFASNSSSYKSGELITKVSDETKKRILNTHYMMPPDSVVVELMTDGHTDQGVLDFIFERQKDAGTHPIIALKESTGFVFNRIWAAIKRETLLVLEEGVSTPKEIDRVFKEQYNAKLGPCQMMDNVGLDTVALIEEHYVKERGISRTQLDWLEKNYTSAGKLGTKSGKGGLYPVPAKGSTTKLLILNIGTAERFDSMDSLAEIPHRGQILTLDPDSGRKATEIVGKRNMVDGIDVSKSTGRMYWTEMGTPSENNGALWHSELDGSDIQPLVEEGKVHTPKQCVVDQQTNKLYFCDREGLRVHRVNLDGSEHEVIVQRGDFHNEEMKKNQTLWCVGVALSHKLGKFFWSQKGASKATQGQIFSANIDLPKGQTAADRKDIELVIGPLPEPIDLEFDDDEGVLYWTDRGELPLGNTLNKKHLIGEAPEVEKPLGRQILAQGFGEAIGLKLDKERDVVWVADISGRVWSCDPHKPAMKQKVYEAETIAFTGITVTHS